MSQATQYLSRKAAGDFMTRQAPLAFQPDIKTENKVINLVPELRYQEIIGFGGAFTEASAECYKKLGEANRKKIIQAYFDPEEGMAYNFCRTHIQACDFAPEGYSYVEENDGELKTFSIDHDRNSILPFLKDARAAAGDALLLFASPWSPPAWMKDNGKTNEGGRLLEKYYPAWANFFVKYFEAYREEGIPFFALTVQNEAKAWQTWESCVYTAEEEGEFAARHLRPALDRAGFKDVGIMIWDHNKERVYDRPRDTFAVPGARDAVFGIAFHFYSGAHYDALDMAHKAFPDKPLLLTEFAFGIETGTIDTMPHSTWTEFELCAKELIGDFNHHVAAIVDWNLMLDQNAGPYHNRDMGCDSPVCVDTEADTVSFEPLFYAIRHFSRFIKRGAVRIGNSSYHDHLRTTAFQNPGGEIVAVVQNDSPDALRAVLRLGKETLEAEFPGDSLSTFVITQ